MGIPAQDAQNIVNEMKRAIGRNINIMDERGVILASTNPARKGQLHRGAQVLLEEGRRELLVREDDPALGVQKGINLPIRIDGRVEGVVGITGEPDQVSNYGKIIQRMTEIMLQGIRQRQVTEQMDRARALFLENWLFENGVDWPELAERGRLLGFDMAAAYTVVLLEVRETREDRSLRELRNQEIVSRIRGRMADDGRCYAAVIHGQVLLLLRDAGRDEVHREVSRICRELGERFSLPFRAGVSDVSDGPEDLRRCYQEAATAVKVSVTAPERTVVFYDQVSLEFVISSIPRSIRRDLAAVVFAGCSPEERQEYKDTILLYFQEGGRIARCAERAFVHRNTFQYRLDRLRQKTGYDIRSPRDSALLYIACLQL